MATYKNNMDDFKKSPFSVPDHFFEQFNQEILTKLPSKGPQKVRFSFRKYVLPWVACAAILSGAFFMLKDKLFNLNNTSIMEKSSTDPVDFASSEDRDFYLFLQDDAARKEITNGNLSE